MRAIRNYWLETATILLVIIKFTAAYNGIEESSGANELDRPIPMEDVQGVLGKKKGLPCDITPRDRDDAVAMVLWFKETILEPLYSFDVRGRQFNQAKLWSAPNIFGNRAFFRATTSPASLAIDNIQLTDEGIYRCRVDFKNSPTRNSKVNFTVIVPPERPVIYDGKRRDRTTLLEPYNEGSDVNLICEVSGGRPRPRVLWFLENRVIDDSYEMRPDGVVVNHLTFPNVGRQHLNERLICQASNTNLVPPATKLVVLNINLKPQTVDILTKEKHVSADKRYEVECRTSGSRPEAIITWWKGSRPVKKLAKNFSEQNNQSLSILTFEPVVEDDGKYLTCRAENPSIPDSALEDKWRLNVHYVPIVTLKMGSSLNPEDIKEGDDVYFECNIRANPKAYKLSWYHNGNEIHHNVSVGVILSDQSLVLQSVTRATAGDFTCIATNVEGKGSSNPVTLTVRYAPVCIQEKDELYGALKQETVTLKCQVDANPALVTFHWTFNNSGDLTEVPVSRFTNELSTSRLNYTPVSEMDYGTLSCWGRNEVGQQKAPCVFQVVAAGKPFPLLNCSMMNQTSDSLQVECTENFDGGLPQGFLMEVLELPSLRSSLNVTTDRTPPHFYADGLEPGASYRIMLYSVNAKGRSDPAILDAVTFKGVAKYTGTTASMPVSPLILGLLGTAGVLGATVCLVLAALCRRHYQRPCHRPDNGNKHVPLEVIPADDLIRDGSVTGLRSPSICDATLTQPLRNGPSQEPSDPDIIKNQYERRTIQGGYMKTYEPAHTRLDEDNEDEADEYDFRHVTKESHIPNQTVYRSLQRTTRVPVVATIPGSHTLTHKYRGPEVVTTSNRIQESCI
ncbi:neural cell adhesion molecule 2 isoform X2 [Onthophagus taurus]|uniref:neural cell adhesion molecule 2 isoform X2 n=1 Tax=Onthophagus taurus TaxID=166361 RepID=UPI000C202477|nr:hemicentin-2-like isoform X2 [Onthophagus taurus]